ncbi:Anaphase-promoting complex subunit 7 [Trifolium repens]|nr:Anaphase-promoting complex subunit 7 [Trifolium repens]
MHISYGRSIINLLPDLKLDFVFLFARHCPFIFEAITALSELGSTAKDIISLFPQTPNRSGRAPFDHMDSSRWLPRYVEAQCCISSNDYKGGLELFADLLQRFPNNIYTLNT